ncbi:DUF1146 family protein, partial [Listeria monocytogenes]
MYNIIMESPYVIIISHLLFIVITFWALQAINYEKFIKKNHVTNAMLIGRSNRIRTRYARF